MMKGNVESVDEYIAAFHEEIREILREMRHTIKEAAPQAEETISYRMPTFKLNGNLVHFAAFKDHIGFFPTPTAIDAFRKELSKYETSKGTIRFPLDKKIPYGLVSKIVKYRVKENLRKKTGTRSSQRKQKTGQAHTAD